jgi:serine/threonine protein kinase
MLAASTRLGPYEVLAPLGSGGMGEVYRARDTRLGREVAVKVLPEPYASNSHRLCGDELWLLYCPAASTTAVEKSMDYFS